jgi:ferrochelatase
MSIGVLVMAYGTPSSREAIEPYYTRIRHGRPPTPELLEELADRYQQIGGTSPLAERTADQVNALARRLEELRPGVFDVRFASKYEPPMIEDVAPGFAADGITRVIGLVLAPHSSSLSTDQYFERARVALGDTVEFRPIDTWWEREDFIQVIADRVTKVLHEIPESAKEHTEVVFSAHSLPVKILEKGDTYPDQIRESARRAAEVAGVARWDTAWQSAGRTADPWLGPDILEVLRTKRAAGTTHLVSCPIGFVSDHLEVLFDIDIQAADIAREIDLTLVRTPSLNSDPAFIDVLARVVEERA